MAGAGCIMAALDVFHDELIAAIRGLNIAREMGMAQVIQETDSLMVKLAVEGHDYDMAATRGPLQELKNLVKFEFQVDFCPRSCNSVAHALAAYGKTLDLSAELVVDETPDLVQLLVAGYLPCNSG
ncbi:hypothetical protein HU200_013508 [Digitaria exilis]|uniref:RNase H type-1 domain-containing protein n=1 Tax=Digitaria exilis TaxID=1010633 RepID=A0A835KKY3_9POAL|nr:hypothetical protein HU200_064414 [Digitaria exilis]KAF8649146.1 hypothetical protein HU200_064411 [Digitaria exilis]KAF8743868.1 hypothetical protein HU200_013508 [Digitaria exilis]